MDGTVAVLESTDGSILAQKKVHTKYVVKAIWAPSSDALVSISWDGTVSVSGQPRMFVWEGSLLSFYFQGFP